MKTYRLLIISAVCWFLAGYVSHAAGPTTNVVTLQWDAPTNSPVPFVYEVHQSLSLATNAVWTVVAANIPSNITTLQLAIDKDLKYWKVRCVNYTNSAWTSDFSNVASTLWPSPGGNLGIRLGL